MCRKLITAVALMALVAVSGCFEEQQSLSVWVFTAPDADLTAYVGCYDGSDVELGGVFKAYGGEQEELDVLGLYLAYYVTQQATITDTGPQSPIAGLLESLSATPFVMVEFVSALHGEQRKLKTNFIAGTEFKTDPASPFSLVLQGIAGDGNVTADNDYALSFGLHYLQ